MNKGDGFRILAVCSGNVCRSPLVELLLARQLAGRPEFTVTSAGTIARPGMRMTVEMVNVAARHGVSPERSATHSATRLNETSVERADLVLGLTREHRAAALQLFPAAVKRVFTLNEFARLVASVGAHSAELTTAELVAEAASRRGVEAPSNPESDDVDDPIGLPQEVYDRVGAEIAASLEIIAPALANTIATVRTTTNDQAEPAEPWLSFSFRER
jgi:protein-tyrosine phosphatase